MRSNLIIALLVGASLLCAGCGSKPADAGDDTAQNAAVAGAAAASAQGIGQDLTQLAIPPSWMPDDYDPRFYVGAGSALGPDAALAARQNMLNTVPFILWAVAHDDRLTEAFEPIWVWYTALRSCDRGIQLSEDLAGEFGDRERGKAALTQARKDLQVWAAKQPAELTLYFPARLGQWDAQNQAFALEQVGQGTPVRSKVAEKAGGYVMGATMQLWTDRGAQAINHLQAAIAAPQCVSADGSRVYTFDRRSQWWVVFGDADRGMGGLVNYRSRAMLPRIAMSRDAAADFARRNPERGVELAVTFAPAGSTFVSGTDQSAIRARLVSVTVTDTQDEAVLATQQY